MIGAGAAGLAAARALGDAGLRVVLAEAQERVGGRILTPEPGIELGAEFVHGRPEATRTLLREYGDRVVEREGGYWQGAGGRFTEAEDRFDGLGALVALARQAPEDRSAAEFFRDVAKTPALAELATWALRLVEGFDAADPARASVKVLAEEWSGDAGMESPQGRPERGYGALVRHLESRLPPQVELRTAWPVRAVEWSRGRVSVTGPAGARVEARAAVITLPLSLLTPSERGARVDFLPALVAKRPALERLHMGAVLKVLLRYESAFWRELDGGRYADAAFFFRGSGAFPTIWTAWPDRAPVLTAWYGGPGAEALSSRSDEAIIAAARESVALVFGAERMAGAALARAWVHNWQRDPWAAGAYSYVGVGGAEARAALAEPLEDTLFFAGEATDASGEASTVAGALASGVRASSQAVRALSSPG